MKNFNIFLNNNFRKKNKLYNQFIKMNKNIIDLIISFNLF
jgi:hypothetical protein